MENENENNAVSGNGTEPPEWKRLFIDCLSFVAIIGKKLEDAESELASLPARWKEDSSLETWFPLTAEELARTKKELAEARAASHNGQGWEPASVDEIVKSIGSGWEGYVINELDDLKFVIHRVIWAIKKCAPPSEAKLPTEEK